MQLKNPVAAENVRTKEISAAVATEREKALNAVCKLTQIEETKEDAAFCKKASQSKQAGM